MPLRNYNETTIPRFYYNNQQDAENLARGDWTRSWWDNHRPDFDLYTSPVVVRELAERDRPNKEQKVNVLKKVSLLGERPEVEEVGLFYARHFLMPARAYAGALHMGFASVYHCDILLTWN